VPNQPLLRPTAEAFGDGVRPAGIGRFVDLVADQLVATEAVLRHLSWSRWSTDTEEETVGAEWGV